MKRIWILSVVLSLTAIVGFACGGDDKATPTTRPTAIPASTATARPVAPTATAQTAAPTATEPAPAAGPVSLTVDTVSSDALSFATESLTVGAGAEVTLTLNNNATAQMHNWVLVKDGTGNAVATAGLGGAATNWVAAGDPNVIANTAVVAAGESTEISFVAPAAGTYQFLCTFPGHNFSMVGTFEVTP